MTKYKDLQILVVVLATFSSMFLTSMLLELELFKHPVRIVLVCLFLLVELYFGFLIFKSFFNKK